MSFASTNETKLSVIIPCYNESDNIPSIFKRFREVLQGEEGIEVLFVNNGSTDNSKVVLNEECKKKENRFAKVVHVQINKGYGYGIISGIREANGEILAWTHADMQTDPADVITAYYQFTREKDVEKNFLKGKRIGRNIFDTFFTFGMSIISSIALGQRLSDVNAQPKMFHRDFLEQMKNPPDDFSLDLYVLYLAQKLGLNILEHPVNFAKRKHGQAKGGGTLKGKLTLIARTWKYICHLRKRLRD